jgi:arylsulfatase A-like enzyme
VPLVVRDPRLAPARRGATQGQLALNLDVAPTLVAAAGLAVPGVMQGRDLSPLYLSARAPDWRDEFFYEHPTVTNRDRIPSSQGVVRRDWKHVEWPEFDVRQLFDLRRDPGELRNLAGQPSYAGREQWMRQRLEAWRLRARGRLSAQEAALATIAGHR